MLSEHERIEALERECEELLAIISRLENEMRLTEDESDQLTYYVAIELERRRCKTYRGWENHNEPLAGLCGLAGGDRSDVCEGRDKFAACAGSDYHHAGLWCGPDFGCVHWEERDD